MPATGYVSGPMASGVATMAAKRVAVAFDRLRPPPAGVTILIYHRVGAGTPTSVDLPTALFDEQMARLAAETNVLTLDQVADSLPSGDRPSEDRPSDGRADDDRPTVAVTFDDGTADFVDHALPVLVRHGVPVTYYLATSFLDEQRPFPNGGTPMTWDAAREMVSSGLVDVGSHTHTHALLDRIPRQEAADELDRSIARIEDEVGHSPHHFAYPKAVLGSAGAEAEVRARFRTATIARTRSNPWGTTDLHRLTRSPVQVSDGLDFFGRKVRGGMGLENDLRDVLNRWRYRGAGS